MLPKHVRYQAALHSVRNDCVRFFSCACLKHELYYTGACAVCQPVFYTFLRVFRIFFRLVRKSFAISALFVHFAYPYFLLFASYRFPFVRFLPNFSPRPCFLCSLNPFSLPSQLAKSTTFLPMQAILRRSLFVKGHPEIPLHFSLLSCKIDIKIVLCVTKEGIAP